MVCNLNCKRASRFSFPCVCKQEVLQVLVCRIVMFICLTFPEMKPGYPAESSQVGAIFNVSELENAILWENIDQTPQLRKDMGRCSCHLETLEHFLLQ